MKDILFNFVINPVMQFIAYCLKIPFAHHTYRKIFSDKFKQKNCFYFQHIPQKILFGLFLIVFSISSAFASCYTGFACSIEELAKLEHQKDMDNANFILKYFSLKHRDFTFNNNSLANYNDIFTYNIIF